MGVGGADGKDWAQNGKFCKRVLTEALSGANPGDEKHFGQTMRIIGVRAITWTCWVTPETKVRAAATRWNPLTKVAFWNYSGQYQMHEAEPPRATSHRNQGMHGSICCSKRQQFRATCSNLGWKLPIISDTVSPLAIFPENGRVLRAMQRPRGLFCFTLLPSSG